MIEVWLTPRRAAWIALILASVSLQACSRQAPTVYGARRYAADLEGGAKTCEVDTKVSPADGQTIETAMKVDSGGGWCGLPVRTRDGKPFDAGLLVERPTHGNVMIHAVGDDTRIDYTPDHGFTGNDGFSVKLVPGNAVLRISVGVAAVAPKA